MPTRTMVAAASRRSRPGRSGPNRLEAVSKPRAGIACVWRWLASALLLPVFLLQYWSSSLLASRRQSRRIAAREGLKQLLDIESELILASHVSRSGDVPDFQFAANLHGRLALVQRVKMNPVDALGQQIITLLRGVGNPGCRDRFRIAFQAFQLQ